MIPGRPLENRLVFGITTRKTRSLPPKTTAPCGLCVFFGGVGGVAFCLGISLSDLNSRWYVFRLLKACWYVSGKNASLATRIVALVRTDTDTDVCWWGMERCIETNKFLPGGALTRSWKLGEIWKTEVLRKSHFAKKKS